MFEQISTFFSTDMIYMWLNIGVIPFWFILIFFPNSKVCGFFVSSIFPLFLFGLVYIYLFYYFYVSEYDFLSNFSLYISLDNLRDLFSHNGFLIIFWTHFLVINLFCGSWIVKDSQKFAMPKTLVFFSIINDLFYWSFRYFYLLVSKNILRKKNFFI